MKVKIKKQGKVKEFKLINKWSDVTLEKWLKLIDFHNESKTGEALKTIEALSNIPKKLIKQLELKDVAVIMSNIAELQKKQNSSLKRLIEVEGKEYGFHPDLDSITLGEYADIETYVKMGLQKHLPEIMAILFRPIVEKEGDVYTIEAYNGDIKIRAEKMKQMNAEQVQKVLVFFWTFVRLLLVILPLSLIKSNQKNNKKE